MIITDLRSSNFLEVFEFLNPKDLLVLSTVSKFFQALMIRFEMLIQKQCLKYLGIDFDNSIIKWQKIFQEVHRPSEEPLVNKFFPYYTNGNTYFQMITYFIGNLIKESRSYCTVLEKNILVKYALSPNAIFDYSTDIEPFRESTNVYCLNYIENQPEIYPGHVAKIEKIHFSIPKGGYTCPAEVFMAFSSYQKVEDFTIINSFHSCVNKENVDSVAKQFNMETNYKLLQDHERVLFKESRNDVKPLCWIKTIYENCNHAGFDVDLDYTPMARYFYLLLISAKNLGSDHNIDMGNAIPLSRVISIRK